MKTDDIVLSYSAATNQRIAAAIFQRITHPGLNKIEVRHPRNAPRVTHKGIQSTLTELTRRQRLPSISLSCRPHDNPLDEASGDTVISFHYNREAQPPAGTRAGFLQRLFGRKSPAESPQADARPVIEELQGALKTAAIAYAHQFRKSPAPEIMQIVITARDERFQALLGSMQDKDLATWSLGQLRQHKLAVSEELAATYRFMPFRAEEGTDLLGAGDLEIDLLDTPILAPGKPAATELHPPHASARPMPSAAQPTQPSQGHTLHELGTLPPDMSPERAFTLELQIESPRANDQEGLLHLPELPARIDRNALIRAGLQRISPEAVHVASQSVPLTVDVTPAGRLFLKAGLHRELGRPMYYYLADGTGPQAITQGVSLPGSEALICINAPQGVRHPDKGHLPPIMLRLRVRQQASAECAGRA